MKLDSTKDYFKTGRKKDMVLSDGKMERDFKATMIAT